MGAHGKEGGNPAHFVNDAIPLFDQNPVPFDILLFQVVEQTAPLSDHLVEAPPGVVVFFVAADAVRVR